MRKILSISVSVALLVAVAGCGSETSSGDSDVFSIVVTTSVHGDIVSAALGAAVPESIAVEVVMPPGADPHDFLASAKQAERMENADLLVTNGLDLEAGLDGIIDAVAETGTPVFVFADHLTRPLDSDDEHHDEHDDEGHDDEGDEPGHDGADPHLWTDPVSLVPIIEALRDELVVQGVDAALLDEPVDVYMERLVQLDAEIEATLAPIPPEQRVLVTNHDAFGYFAARYGFDVVGTVIPSLTTNAEVSSAALDDLAAVMRERSVRAIFAENTESDRLAWALADEVGGGVRVVELFSGSLGPSGSGAETYLSMMTTNADLIAEALRS